MRAFLVWHVGKIFRLRCQFLDSIPSSLTHEPFSSFNLVCCPVPNLVIKEDSQLTVHAEGDYLYRPFRIQWFEMAVVDSSAFYLSLANAALFLSRVNQQGGLEYSDCIESANYYSECLNQVTKRLASRTEGISQGVITTILGFLCHDVRTLSARTSHANNYCRPPSGSGNVGCFI